MNTKNISFTETCAPSREKAFFPSRTNKKEDAARCIRRQENGARKHGFSQPFGSKNARESGEKENSPPGLCKRKNL